MMTATASFAFAQGADVKIAVPVEPANIDGCNTTVNGINTIVKENIVETLTVLDPNDSKVLPRLATKWEDQGNGTWRISLREGVSFHDGKPFNADAVVKAITRMQSTGVTCLDRTKIANVKLTATAIDHKTVDIHADPAQVLMPVFLSFMGITGPDTSPTELSRAPVGTGPFQFVSWDGDGVKLKRNDNYWGKKPEVENATYVFRGESALRAAMVKTGEADF
jgi:peptide/nickel transport system substrate-binding protein